MSDKPYIRNPKGITSGGKWDTNEEDKEDYEQERRIQEWLKQQGNSAEFGYEYINRKGNARNTLIKASVRLDQKIGEDGTGTFADLIVGSDGRDLVGGDEPLDPEVEAREIIHGYLFALGFQHEEILWLIKTLKLSVSESKSLFEKLAIDSEW